MTDHSSDEKELDFFGRLMERRKLWKEAKRKRRQDLKEQYKYAPLVVKLWNLYLKGPLHFL